MPTVGVGWGLSVSVVGKHSLMTRNQHGMLWDSMDNNLAGLEGGMAYARMNWEAPQRATAP